MEAGTFTDIVFRFFSDDQSVLARQRMSSLLWPTCRRRHLRMGGSVGETDRK